MADLIKIAEEAFATGKEHPKFKAGDTVTVAYKIVEGNKERIQQYRGVVIKISGQPEQKTFSRFDKMSGTVGVERIFPIESPNIDSIVVNKIGKVRRAKLYYLRKLTGKKAVSQKNVRLPANKSHTFQNHTASESISHERNFPTLIFSPYPPERREVRPNANPRL